MKHLNYVLVVALVASIIALAVALLAGCASEIPVALIGLPAQLCVASVFVGLALWLVFYAFNNQGGKK